MTRKTKHNIEKEKTRKPDKNSIEELKEKIQHQKDALNKIIKSYSK